MTQYDVSNIINLAREIQSIPSPTFGEIKRAEFLADQFNTQSHENVEIDSNGNVLVKIKGGCELPLVISAHLDSVLIPEHNKSLVQCEKRITGPGIGDNALGVAVLVEIAKYLYEQKTQLPGDIWLVGDVGEEGLGNLKGMRQIVDRFKNQVTGYLALEGIGLGMVQTAALGIHRYQIEVNTQGGHAWSNFGDSSAIHELVKLSSEIISIPLQEKPRSSINIGSITGGGSINSIASHAEMQLEIRSEDQIILESLAQSIHVIAANYQSKAELIISEIGSRPSGKISENAPVIVAAQSALINLGITPNFVASSTDASLPISLGYPATCLGITTGRRVHTLHETIDLHPIATGFLQIINFINHLWNCT